MPTGEFQVNCFECVKFFNWNMMACLYIVARRVWYSYIYSYKWVVWTTTSPAAAGNRWLIWCCKHSEQVFIWYNSYYVYSFLWLWPKHWNNLIVWTTEPTKGLWCFMRNYCSKYHPLEAANGQNISSPDNKRVYLPL